MKKIVLFIALAASLGGSVSWAQDTVWMKPAPLSNYFSNNWLDTTERYCAAAGYLASGWVQTKRFYSPDTLQVYGIAAMMTDRFFGRYTPTPAYPTLQSYLDVTYPMDPSYENCEEQLVLYQYDGSDPELMLQQGEGLPVHLLYTPVSYYIMSNTPIVSYRDTIPKIEQVPVSAADAQRVCDEVNCYIRSHYAVFFQITTIPQSSKLMDQGTTICSLFYNGIVYSVFGVSERATQLGNGRNHLAVYSVFVLVIVEFKGFRVLIHRDTKPL